jgi:hypothetical protein
LGLHNYLANGHFNEQCGIENDPYKFEKEYFNNKIKK